VDRTTTEPGAYPLVLVSYVIACPTYDSQAKADLVKGYLTYVLGTEGQAAAAEAAGSAPLSTGFGKDAVAAVDRIAAKS
jgi:phosphate transport system substrate-binding protein